MRQQGHSHSYLICGLIILGFKNLRSLEVCGGGLTDAGVKNIKDLSSLTMLNLSQNHHLTDRTLELISGTSCILNTYGSGCGKF